MKLVTLTRESKSPKSQQRELSKPLSGRQDAECPQTVLLLEYSPELPVGYTINLLKSAALAHPTIRDRYKIECRTISAAEYPFEQNELTHSRRDNALLCELLTLKPSIVGFSVFVWNINYFTRLTRMLRLMSPHCKIIWGGKLVTNHWQVLVKENPDVDCFCIGEGELVFQNYLLHLLEYPEPEEPIPGTMMKIKGQHKMSMMPAPLPDLGNLPNPYIEKLIDPKTALMANIETLRGCLYHCTFCDWGGKDYRRFSDEFVCDAIKAILEQKFENVFFMDSIFALKLSRQKKFLRAVLDNYNDHSLFGFEIMLEMLDDEVMELFRELARRKGLAKIEIGLQSINQETLNIIKRPLTLPRFVDRYNKLVRNAPYLQDTLQIDLIIGLPRETWESFGKGLNLVFSLDPDKISAFPLEIFPGSEMHGDQMEKYGLVALERQPFSIISTNDMSTEEIQKLSVLSWVATSLRSLSRRSLFYLHHMNGENIFGFMEDFSAWCIKKRYVNSWYDYGQLEDHAMRLVEYISSEDFSAPNSHHLMRLKQLFLFELAPLMVIQSKEKEFQSLWRKAHAGEFKDAGTQAIENSGLGVKRALFWFDHIVEYTTHPESSVDALAAKGKQMGLLVEAYGNSYRTSSLSREEFEAAVLYVGTKEIYVAKKERRTPSNKTVRRLVVPVQAYAAN